MCQVMKKSLYGEEKENALSLPGDPGNVPSLRETECDE